MIALLLGAAACAVMFIVVYALDWPHLTQYLGICLGVALALIAAALIVTGEKLVVTEELEEDYPALGDPEEEAEVEQIVARERQPPDPQAAARRRRRRPPAGRSARR